MEINKEAIDIHYHYDIVRMTASQGYKFVTKPRCDDFADGKFTDEEWDGEFPMKYANFNSADILVIAKADENSPHRRFSKPFREDGSMDIDVEADEIDRW